MKTLITILLIIASTISYSQSVNRIVRNMAKDDFERGRELANRALEDNAQDPGANFCLSWMAFEEEDYFIAYKHIISFRNNIDNLDPDDREEIMEYMKEEMTKMRKKSFDERIEKRYQNIEETTINYVREKLDPELASKYIEMFPNSPYLDNTVHIRNHYAYLKAKNAGSVDSLIKFKKKYPDAAQQQLALEQIHKLKFKKAKAQKSLRALNEFVEKYPLAKQRTEAIQLRNKLAYQKAKNLSTLDAIDRFIEQYPDALQLSSAKKLRQKLVFEKAKEINTIEAYTNFVKEYPFGKYYVDIFNLKAKALGKRMAEKANIQNPGLTRAFDYDQTSDSFSASATDNSGNTYIAGTVDMDTAPAQNVWILKVNPEGKMLWNKQFGSPADDEIDEIFPMNNGSITALGKYGKTDTTAGQGWILNISEKGKKNWMKLLTNLYPTSSTKAKKHIVVGGYHNTDSIQKMKLVRFDQEANKIFHRNYSTRGTIRSIKSHSEGGQVFCGKNWICHINNDGYIQYDKYLDSTLTLLGVAEKEGVIYAAGINQDFNLFFWNTNTRSVAQTKTHVKELQFLKNTDLLVLDSSNSLIQLSNTGEYVKDIARNLTDFKKQGQSLFFTSKNTILKSNIVYIQY